MLVPALNYLGDVSTSHEAIECLRRDLVSGETSCDALHRARIWKALLLSRDETEFSQQFVEDSRARVKALRESYMQMKPDETFDPLSESESWSTYFKDQELRTVIMQDCLRVFPEQPWFQGQEQQAILQDCLFLWSKENAAISYKQGMHELAGIIVWVTMHDSTYVPENVLCDTYLLFEALLRSAKDFYATSSSGSSAILNRIETLHTGTLQTVDQELWSRLRDLNIEPQLYCMKWLRLIFSREFPFEDVLVLWDHVFAADPSLKIVDYVCCAMIMRIRQEILCNDHTVALTTLMRYPPPKTPPASFLQDALHLQNFCFAQGGSQIIQRYHEGTLVDTEALALDLKPGPVQGYTIGSLLERTDALGLNGYVRVAVDEVRRNVTPLLNETKHVLARTHSRDSTPNSSNSSDANIHRETRDRELAMVIATAVANIRRGDRFDNSLASLEEVKLVLLGRKSISQISKGLAFNSPQARPSSAPQPVASSSAARRALSPIRMPAIRTKARSPGRTAAIDSATESSNGHEDIPLSVSPERSSHKKAADYSFLFGNEEPAVSTFNRSRHS